MSSTHSIFTSSESLFTESIGVVLMVTLLKIPILDKLSCVCSMVRTENVRPLRNVRHDGTSCGFRLIGRYLITRPLRVSSVSGTPCP